jgi:hypothetical protein
LVGASLPLRAVNPVGPQQAMPPAPEAMDRVRATRVSILRVTDYSHGRRAGSSPEMILRTATLSTAPAVVPLHVHE